MVLLEPLAGVGALHAEGTFTDADGGEQPFAVSLGPRHGPITVAQIDEALAEAPGYSLIVFAGFAATAEAQQYLAPGRRGRINVALLEANADLLLGGLLKNTKASQTFRLFAAPEATRSRRNGRHGRRSSCSAWTASTRRPARSSRATRTRSRRGFSITTTTARCSTSTRRSSRARTPWEALGKALKDTIDQDVVESMHSFVSLPFEPGPTRKAALRAVDDAGQTSEAILDLGA